MEKVPHWRTVVLAELMSRDNDFCFFCGEHLGTNGIVIHHKFPVKMGGEDRLNNLALAHHDCHTAWHKKLDAIFKDRVMLIPRKYA